MPFASCTPLSFATAPAFDDYSGILWWLFWISVGSLVLTLVLMPVVVVRLPADYFIARHRRENGHVVLRIAWRILRNVLGALFVVAGIAMLVLPGQGLLTLLIGIMLLQFPGKRKLELKIVRRPRILRFLNRMREKRGKEPLRVE